MSRPRCVTQLASRNLRAVEHLFFGTQESCLAAGSVRVEVLDWGSALEDLAEAELN